jgi:hypothetical protein
MEAIRWYIAREGQKVGPFESSELRQLALMGFLQPTELVWTEGLSKWVEASSFPALFPQGGQKYWVHVNGQTRGPYSVEQLRAGLVAREFTLDAPACPENEKEWQPLNKRTEFRHFVPQPVTPSHARLMAGTLDIEEARLHLAGKAGDVLAKLISMLLDLQKGCTENPGLAENLERTIKVLQARRAEMARSVCESART